MAVKWTVQGVLIYAALAANLLAFGLLAGRARRVGTATFAAGFALAAGCLAVRWVAVGRVPLQSLYEVFLALAVAVFPLSLFAERVLGAAGRTTDALLGAVVLFPAGFVFRAGPLELPPALQSWLFLPHVAAYMLAYVVLAQAAFQAVRQLAARPSSGRSAELERATFRLVRFGLPLLTLGLVLGAWWGKLAWGDYWNWDPKELWSLASWLAFVGYVHFRGWTGARHPRVNSVLVMLGLAAIVLTLLWVNLAGRFSGLHSYAAQ